MSRVDESNSYDRVDRAHLNGHRNSLKETEEGGRTENIDINRTDSENGRSRPVGSRYWYPTVRFSLLFAFGVFVDAAVAIILWLTGRDIPEFGVSEQRILFPGYLAVKSYQ